MSGLLRLPFFPIPTRVLEAKSTMPIEFKCPNCATVLRTPDASAGKKARCPQCGTIADVPETSPQSGESTAAAGPAAIDGDVRSGVSEHVQRSPFGEQAAGEPVAKPVDSKNPYASPSLQEPMTKPSSFDEAARKGLPWEAGEKSFATFWETAKLILSSPSEAFRMVRRDGGLVTPLLFAVAGGLAGALFSAVYGSLMQLAMFGVMSSTVGEGPDMAVGAGMLVFQVVLQFGMALVGGTVGVVIGLFISSAIYHVALLMLKGANHPFDATFTVVAYVTGATALIQVVPICGQYVYGIVALVYAIIGLSAVQQVSGGKAAAAVLLPLVICTVAMVMVIGGIIALAVGLSGGF
jgi:hypothetical protein